MQQEDLQELRFKRSRLTVDQKEKLLMSGLYFSFEATVPLWCSAPLANGGPARRICQESLSYDSSVGDSITRLSMSTIFPRSTNQQVPFSPWHFGTVKLSVPSKRRASI